MSTTPTRFLLAVLALFAVGVYWFGRGGVSSDGVTVERSVATEPQAPPAGAPLDNVAVRVAASETTRRQIDPAQRAVTGRPRIIVALAGVVVVREADGTERRDLSGVMNVTVWGGGWARPTSVSVVEGRFRFELLRRSDGKLETLDGKHIRERDGVSLEVSGGALVFDDGEALPYDAEQAEEKLAPPRHAIGTLDAVISLRRIDSVRINVVDATSGSHLSGVRVVTGNYGTAQGFEHPGSQRAGSITTDTVSPVLVTPNIPQVKSGSTTRCYVGAEGYAWAAVGLNLAHGGQRTVELTPGGRLDVTLQGDIVRGAMLRLYRVGEVAPYTDRHAMADRELRYEGVAPGAYSVRVETGGWGGNALVLAKSDVIILAHVTETVILDVMAPPKATTLSTAMAMISGVLVVPPDWGIDYMALTFRLLGSVPDGSITWHQVKGRELHPIAGTAGTFAFELGPVAVGAYSVTFQNFGNVQHFELGSGGLTDLRMEIPPPVDITVAVQKAGTGAATDVTEIDWVVTQAGGTGSYLATAVTLAKGDDRFKLRVPRCQIRVSASAEGYSRASTEIEAIDGLDVLLELEPVAEASVRLMDGKTRVPWPVGFEWDLTALEGDGRLSSHRKRPNETWLTVTEPGRYRLEIPVVNGYERHAPVEVELVAGERMDVVVQMVPK